MTTKEYQEYFQSIINQEITTYPYDKPDYLEYTKLNYSRFNRWLKLGEIQSENINLILSINEPQEWVIITEPWCGDAAHIVPFIFKLASFNSLIQIKIQLRDSKDSEIESYLTNGTKSIPILIARKNGEDLFCWGPRPKLCQEIINSENKTILNFEQMKESIQKWYNSNKGIDIQTEICQLINLG